MKVDQFRCEDTYLQQGDHFATETLPVKCGRFYTTIYIIYYFYLYLYKMWDNETVQWLQYLRKISSAKPNDLFYTGSHIRLPAFLENCDCFD